MLNIWLNEQTVGFSLSIELCWTSYFGLTQLMQVIYIKKKKYFIIDFDGLERYFIPLNKSPSFCDTMTTTISTTETTIIYSQATINATTEMLIPPTP